MVIDHILENQSYKQIQLYSLHAFLEATISQTDPPLQSDQSIVVCHWTSSFIPKCFINVLLHH